MRNQFEEIILIIPCIRIRKCPYSWFKKKNISFFETQPIKQFSMSRYMIMRHIISSWREIVAQIVCD